MVIGVKRKARTQDSTLDDVTSFSMAISQGLIAKLFVIRLRSVQVIHTQPTTKPDSALSTQDCRIHVQMDSIGGRWMMDRY